MTKILVVEDEILLGESMCEILTYEGYEVILAENGEIGLQAVFEQMPDLILCDIMMPVMDGHELLYRIRTNENTKLIPFIFMTAMAKRSDLRAGMELGSDDYLTKPCSREELLTAVGTRLRKSRDINQKVDLSLNELRAKIISHMPHELRTPLNGIIGFGQMLKDYPETIGPEDLPEIGKTIFESAQRLNRLIRNYLTYTKLELEQITSLHLPLLTNAYLLCERSAREKALSYHRLTDLDLNLEMANVRMGEEELTKIVEEIVDNAFKFSEVGTKVTVNCFMRGDQFCLIVEDKGCGICKDDISKIGAYMQFDRKTKEQQGSGLGLIITKKLVEYFGGSFFIKSVLGEGTSVEVSLPGI